MAISKTKPKKDLWELTVELVGPPKSGKTSLASCLPNPLFLFTEAGQGGKELNHWTPKGWSGEVYILQSMADVDAAIAELSIDTQGFQTLVIDTIDNLVAMVAKDIADHHREEGLNWGNLGYGRGTDLLQQRIRSYISRMAKLKMGLWLLSHQQEVKDDESRLIWRDSLDNKSKLNVQSATDAIWFIKREGKKRVLCTEGEISIEAGSRIRLPERIPMGENEQEAYQNLVKAFYGNGQPSIATNGRARESLLDRIRKGESYLAEKKIDNFDTELRIVNSRKKHCGVEDLEKAEVDGLEAYLQHLIDKTREIKNGSSA